MSSLLLLLLLCCAGVSSAWRNVLPLSDPGQKAVRAKSLPFPVIHDQNSLEAAIRDVEEGSSLVVLFHKDRCRRCQQLKPLIGRLAHESAAAGSTLQHYAQVLVHNEATSSAQALCDAEGVQKLPHLRVYRPGVPQDMRCDVSVGPRGTGPVLGYAELRRTVERCTTCQVAPERANASPEQLPLDAAAVMTAVPLSLIAVLSSLGARIASDIGPMAA
jgi:hypothetical protein